MDILLQLTKGGLQDVAEELAELCSPNSTNDIQLHDFCYVFLKRSQAFFQESLIDKAIRQLCNVFDAVDADSRGVISWSDLTNFFLRLGRNRFRVTVKQSQIEYIQRMDLMPLLPVRKICFIQGLQLLFCFDKENSTIRVFR